MMRKYDEYLYLGVILGALIGIQRILGSYLSITLPSPQYEGEEFLNPWDYLPIIVALLVIFISISLIMSFFKMYGIRYTSNLIKGKKENIFRLVFRRLPSIILLAVLQFLIYAAALGLMILPALLSPACICMSGPIALIVFFLLIIRLAFSYHALIIENLSPLDSLKKSWEITSGKTIETLVFLIIASLPPVPSILISSAIPERYFYISIIFDLITGYFLILTTVTITRGYLELSEERKKNMQLSTQPGPATGSKEIFAFGLSVEEVNALASAGIRVIPVSFRAEQVRVGDLIAYSDFYAGDSSWYPHRLMLMYGLGVPEMKYVIERISGILPQPTIFGTVNIRNIDMSVADLLGALESEHDSQKI